MSTGSPPPASAPGPAPDPASGGPATSPGPAPGPASGGPATSPGPAPGPASGGPATSPGPAPGPASGGPATSPGTAPGPASGGPATSPGPAPGPAVGGPVTAPWREGTLTRAKELRSLCDWMMAQHPSPWIVILGEGVKCHLEAAKQAARVAPLVPHRRMHLLRYGSLRQRALSNLDAAEAGLLNIAPSNYVLGQMPSILQHVRRHLLVTDPRRQSLERIARQLGVNDPDQPAQPATQTLGVDHRKCIADQERGQIVTAFRAASSEALREQVRLRSFGNVLVATTIVMSLLGLGVAIAGWVAPTLIPLCFAPEESGYAVVVCPTQQSAPFRITQPGVPDAATTTRDIDDVTAETVSPRDLMVVELVGLTAAAVAAAAAIRSIRGSSESYALPVALAALKLPTGAITAFLGLLLMRGQFVPGLSALDTSAQILAWALVFGYAQQLFTRLVDRQGQVVLDSIRGASKPTTPQT